MRTLAIGVAVLQLTIAGSAYAADDATTYKAFLAKIAISEWGAIPILIDLHADVGTLYTLENLSQERPASRGVQCYRDRYLEKPAGRPSILMHQGAGVAASIHAGIPLRKYFTDLGIGGSYSKATSTTYRLDRIQIEGPWSDWPLSDPDNTLDDEACNTLRTYISGVTAGLLGFRTIHSSLRIETFLDVMVAADVEAKLGSETATLAKAKARILKAHSDYLIIEGEQTLIALQPTKLDPRELAKIYAYFNDNPDSYAELQMLVDNYLAGTDPDFWERRSAEIKGWLEKHWWGGKTLDDFVIQIFSSEEARPLSEIEEEVQTLGQIPFEASGYLAAAIVISSEKN